ncbi:M14 family zinc carboxypeptidase [Gelidibacter salicanalis]|uniref:Peptidase M14 n=1 Tax=Gelidibacter salicanalis TaxID=291193 RepID=A0A934NK54_9FLAO|nr:M14 family zinc carboxypeptidase [Gelidibacter salicanalis]MBJ7882689.1 peptidase M14 [Gelidibacter salicanalis]
MEIAHLQHPYNYYQESLLFGRYINADHLQPLLKKHSGNFEIAVIGKSVLLEDIHFIKIGTGTIKVLMWSQMHGNESTTTKALFDLLNVFSDHETLSVQDLLSKVTLGIIPMLNPDGSRGYTRVNANQVDLNRDAQMLTQPESKVLRTCFDSFKPHYCFNLHGQRTIFSAGATDKSATVSFLSPAQDADCTVTITRKKAMDVIVKMDQVLQEYIPGQVGTYDDAFNLNCVGDTFQTLNVPTILFEAGHYLQDYDREVVRGFIFLSIWTALVEIAFEDVAGVREEEYFAIPKNDKLFYDIIIRNAKLKIGDVHQIIDIAVQYVERLEQNEVIFIPKIEKIADLRNFYGHKEIQANGHLVISESQEALKEGFEIDFVFINDIKYLLNV